MHTHSTLRMQVASNLGNNSSFYYYVILKINNDHVNILFNMFIQDIVIAEGWLFCSAKDRE